MSQEWDELIVYTFGQSGYQHYISLPSLENRSSSLPISQTIQAKLATFVVQAGKLYLLNWLRRKWRGMCATIHVIDLLPHR